MVGYEQDDTLTPNQKIIAGCISGGMTRFITQPLDIIKLRTQLQKKGGQKRFFRTTRAIFKEEGVTAFWAGHNLGQIHSVLAVSKCYSERPPPFLSNDEGKPSRQYGKKYYSECIEYKRVD